MGHKIDYKREFRALLQSKPSAGDVKKRFEELKEEYISQKEEELAKHIDDSNYHDKIMDVCISAFSPGSICYNNLGYEFISTEPLIERTYKEEGIKNFDLMIINSEQKNAIFVECKSSISNPGKIITDTYSAIEICHKNKEYLEERVGNKINSMEFVICLPPSHVDHLVREIEKRELSGKIDLKNDSLLKIWQIDMFKEEPRLQLFTRIKSREKPFQTQHIDAGLTKILADSVEITDSEILIKTHPSSHPMTRGKWVIIEIFNLNKDCDPDERIFTRYQIEQFFEASGTISHYASEELSKPLTESFINESLAYGIIEKVEGEEDVYRLKIKGKKIDTILSNYKRAYMKGYLDRIATKVAMEKTVKEFREKQPSLF